MLSLPINRVLTYTAGALTIGGGVLCSAPTWGNLWFSDDLALLSLPLAGVAVGLPSFVALCAGCRCRGCGHKLFWHAVSARSHPAGLNWFLSATECPSCGYSEQPTRTASHADINE